MYPEYNFGPLRVEFTTAQVIPYFSSKLHGIYDRANSTVCVRPGSDALQVQTNQSEASAQPKRVRYSSALR